MVLLKALTTIPVHSNTVAFCSCNNYTAQYILVAKAKGCLNNLHHSTFSLCNFTKNKRLVLLIETRNKEVLTCCTTPILCKNSPMLLTVPGGGGPCCLGGPPIPGGGP